MLEEATYSARETLRDGCRIEIRAMRPDDRAAILAAIGRTSVHSLFRRFFVAKQEFTDRELEFFIDVDFKNHVALVAVAEENQRPSIVGGARYIVVQPGTAEVALTVIDQYQGRGMGGLLMKHLLATARSAHLQELIADVLPANTPMLKVFERCGCPTTTARQVEVVHVSIRLG